MQASTALARWATLGDGEVGVAWVAAGGAQPEPAEGRELLACARVGGATLHPLRDAVRACAGADAGGGGFLLVFRVDPALAAAATGADGEVDLDALQRLCDAAVMEPANAALRRESVLLVLSAGESRSLDEALAAGSGCEDASGALALPLIDELTARRRARACAMLPVGPVAAARDVLEALLFAPALDQLPRPTPVLVAAEGGQYVGLCLDGGSRAEEHDSYVVLSSLPAADVRALRSVDALAGRFLELGAGMPSSCHVKAVYELLGSPGEPRAACVALAAEWSVGHAGACAASASRLLAPPALMSERAALVVRGANVVAGLSGLAPGTAPDDSSSVAQTLKVLGSLAASVPTEPVRLDAGGDAAWDALVREVLQSAGDGSLFASSSSSSAAAAAAAAAGDDDEDDNEDDGAGDEGVPCAGGKRARAVRRGRSDLDFTELFWQRVALRARSWKQLLQATRLLLDALDSGSLLPYVHKSNHTVLGAACRAAIDKQLGKGAQSAAPEARAAGQLREALSRGELSAPAQRVLADGLWQLGAWKLSRDFEAWFLEVGVQADQLRAIFPEPADAGSSESDKMQQQQQQQQPRGAGAAIARFTALAKALQVAGTALTFRCPRHLVRALAQAALRHASATVAGDAGAPPPTFVVPLSGQPLPWVRDDASGAAPLPSPHSWQLIHRDRQGRCSQTLRLAPLGAAPQQELACHPLCDDAARRALQMLRAGEPDSSLRALLLREYTKQQQQQATATTPERQQERQDAEQSAQSEAGPASVAGASMHHQHHKSGGELHDFSRAFLRTRYVAL
jgi:hypothetical protein